MSMSISIPTPIATLEHESFLDLWIQALIKAFKEPLIANYFSGHSIAPKHENHFYSDSYSIHFPNYDFLP